MRYLRLLSIIIGLSFVINIYGASQGFGLPNIHNGDYNNGEQYCAEYVRKSGYPNPPYLVCMPIKNNTDYAIKVAVGSISTIVLSKGSTFYWGKDPAKTINMTITLEDTARGTSVGVNNEEGVACEISAGQLINCLPWK